MNIEIDAISVTDEEIEERIGRPLSKIEDDKFLWWAYVKVTLEAEHSIRVEKYHRMKKEGLL